MNVCKSLCPALKSLWIFQCTAEKLHAFYFSRVGENSTWVPPFTKLIENPEHLKIKIDVFGNHRGNVTNSLSVQLLPSLVVGICTVIPTSYKLGRTLCPFGIVIPGISIWGGRKESLHSTEESSS